MTMNQFQDSTTGAANIVAAHGFGLMTKAVVEQHFDRRGGRLERFMGLLHDNDRLDALAEHRGAGRQMIGLAVEQGAALVLQGNRAVSLGKPTRTCSSNRPAGGASRVAHARTGRQRATRPRRTRRNAAAGGADGTAAVRIIFCSSCIHAESVRYFSPADRFNPVGIEFAFHEVIL